VKLLDFGLAKSDDREQLAQEADAADGAIGGTVQFMSPEQTRGDVLDARSDLFSLGIVLYELTTGQRPFKRQSGLATMEAIRTIHPASLRSLNPETPEDLELIIAKLLEKDPASRYHSAADLRSDLECLKVSLQAAQAERGRALSEAGNGATLIAAAEPPVALESEERLVTRVWRRRAWYVAPFVIAALLFLILAGIVLYQRLANA
jgi:serine/threonine protein kinase